MSLKTATWLRPSSCAGRRRHSLNFLSCFRRNEENALHLRCWSARRTEIEYGNSRVDWLIEEIALEWSAYRQRVPFAGTDPVYSMVTREFPLNHEAVSRRPS
jgi:hypothetical protein